MNFIAEHVLVISIYQGVDFLLICKKCLKSLRYVVESTYIRKRVARSTVFKNKVCFINQSLPHFEKKRSVCDTMQYCMISKNIQINVVIPSILHTINTEWAIINSLILNASQKRNTYKNGDTAW